MKIRDIVTEAPTALSNIKKDYQAGYDAVDRVLNPSRWFDDDKADADEAKPINKVKLKNAVDLVVAGKKIYLADQQALKQAYVQIKAGNFETAQDSAALLTALKAAAALQKLSPEQQHSLLAFSKEL